MYPCGSVSAMLGPATGVSWVSGTPLTHLVLNAPLDILSSLSDLPGLETPDRDCCLDGANAIDPASGVYPGRVGLLGSVGPRGLYVDCSLLNGSGVLSVDVFLDIGCIAGRLM